MPPASSGSRNTYNPARHAAWNVSAMFEHQWLVSGGWWLVVGEDQAGVKHEPRATDHKPRLSAICA
jgi:hypothetical protein